MYPNFVDSFSKLLESTFYMKIRKFTQKYKLKSTIIAVLLGIP